MKQVKAFIRQIKQLTRHNYCLILEDPYISQAAQPGQFLHLRTGSGLAPFLRRPFSVAGANPADGTVCVIFRRIGTGTDLLSCMQEGDPLDCLGPLGTPFTPGEEEPAVLLGGGMGIAPLLFLGERLANGNKKVHLFYGAADSSALLPLELFLPPGIVTHLVTEDGSAGEQGLLPHVFQQAIDDGLSPGEIFACGPRPLLALLAQKNRLWGYPMQVSLEENMACGIGACQGCAALIQRAGEGANYERVCREGPVFRSEEVVW